MDFYGPPEYGMYSGIFRGILYPQVNERYSPCLLSHLDDPSPALDHRQGLALAKREGSFRSACPSAALSPLHPRKHGEVLTTRFVFPGAYLCFSKQVVLMLASPGGVTAQV